MEWLNARPIRWQMKSKVFAPTRLMWGGFIIGFIGFCALGNWQINRAEQKEQLIIAYYEANQANPVAFNEAITSNLPNQRRIFAQGRWLSEKTVLQDNVTQENGVSGFNVMTAFALDSGTIVWVDRGWKAWLNGVKNIPELPILATGPVRIEGRTAQPLRRFSLGDSPVEQGWPKVVQVFKTTQTQPWFQKPVADHIIQWKSADEDGLLRQWPVVYGNPDKHRAYAMQWFSFAFILLVLFVYLNRRKAG